MALGARAGDVIRLFVGRGLGAVGAGVVAGVVLAAWLGRLVRSMLVDVSPIDPMSLGAASLLLVIVAVAAAYVPACRAARVDPMEALRYE